MYKWRIFIIGYLNNLKYILPFNSWEDIKIIRHMITKEKEEREKVDLLEKGVDHIWKIEVEVVVN